MLREGDHVTAIDFEGVPQASVVANLKTNGKLNLVAFLPKCAAGDHSECVNPDLVAPHNTRHGWVAFLNNAEEGVHYALGWEGPEVDALKAVAALGGV